jgi:putative oxygen-independent coproporphyrinogen III oxidase
VPSVPPDGGPAPDDGRLPDAALAGAGDVPLGFYLHVPFCATRCGYCDFNTYTSSELGGPASAETWADDALAEIRLARRVLGDVDVPVSTVFVGGGTPTLLPPGELVRVLAGLRSEFGLTADAEVTTEANPDSVGPGSLDTLRAGGFTRMSFGMQSTSSHVLAVLERTHTAGRAVAAAAEARAAGFEHVNLDLIYGTPGETDADWRDSVGAVVDAGVDHVSAYSLIVEDGTRLARRVRRGELAEPDPDVLADRYEIADEMFARTGMSWYEVSNWSRPGGECRHNLAYWTGTNWWGIGPGAHSHVDGVRWWNVRHPTAWAGRLAQGLSPAHAREELDATDRHVERVLLELRLSAGLDVAVLDDAGRAAADVAAGDGLLDAARLLDGRVVLTPRGRLLADAVVRTLLSWE